MALSDACDEFLNAIKSAASDADRREAVRELQRGIAFYSEPPFRYGDELGTLREACSTYLLNRSGPGAVDEPLRRISFVCEAIRDHLDMPPGFKVLTS
jgi:hypothetical protein